MVSVLTEGELENQEAELTRRMNEKRERKTQTAGALAEAKREVDHFRDSYEIVSAEDKALDKAFKKEFADQDVHTVEQLYKLFKRRPRWVEPVVSEFLGRENVILYSVTKLLRVGETR